MPKQMPSSATLSWMQEKFESYTKSIDGVLPVTQAQSAFANEYGFLTWRQMEAYFEIPERNPLDFHALACLVYFYVDNPSRRERARQMYEENQALGRESIYSAATVGDVNLVRDFLERDPTLADRRGGFFDWEPMLYACYSRLDLPQFSTFEVVKLLLDRGANPDAYYNWGGNYRFTVLTGAFGEGEMGPVNQPQHEKWEELALLLLDAGANPNDGQALYNRMFQNRHRCLEILLEHGLNKSHTLNWGDYKGTVIEPFDLSILEYQLEWAIGHKHQDRARLIVEHDVNLNTTWQGLTPYQLCVETGQFELAEYLVEKGAERSNVSDLQIFKGACASGDLNRLQAMLEASPDLSEKVKKQFPELLIEVASEGDVVTARSLLELGFPISKVNGRTAMHEAAFKGRQEIVELLLSKGADRSIRDDHFACTALEWSRVGGSKEVEEVLSTGRMDIFEAIIANNHEEMKRALDADATATEAPLATYMDDGQTHENGWMTPLAFAAMKNQADAVSLLISRGANTAVKNQDGTALLKLLKESSAQQAIIDLLSK